MRIVKNSVSWKLVHLTNVPKSSVHRLITSLINEGYLTQIPQTGHYRLGIDILALGGVVNSRHKLYREALPLGEKLA